MTSLVEVVVIVIGSGGGLAGVVGGMGIDNNYTPSKLVLLEKWISLERTTCLFDSIYTIKIFVLSVYPMNQPFSALD